MANKGIKAGDMVRFLNAVGGGRVVRIDGNLAYVDDDGFETPVLLSECVVVGKASFDTAMPVPKEHSAQNHKDTQAEVHTKLPIVETATGDSLNIVLGFEPVDIKTLSRSSFEAYIVNDSNYYLYITVATRSRLDNDWTHVFDGLIEPNIQEFAFEIDQTALSKLDRIYVQYLAFKRDKAYAAKASEALELKVDATKFARLHCFRPNPYFDRQVISFDIAVNDGKPFMTEIDARTLEEGIREKKRDVKKSQATVRPPKPKNDGPVVVDLHASELLDNVAGLSSADILNMQVDRFSEVMDANLRKPGQTIVFIHGKGEGVLRQAIMKELTHRYKGHDVQDASFCEYGFGATQVTIRSLSEQANKKR